MQFLKKASIQRKQTAIIMLTTGITLLLVCAAFAVYEVLTFRKSMVANLTTLAEIVGNNSAAAVDFNDGEAAQETLAALRAEPDIIGACIYSKQGAPFVTYNRDGNRFPPPLVQTEGHHFGDHSLRLFRPIVQKGETIGVVYLEADLQALSSRLTRYAAIAAVVLLVALVVAFLISARLQRLVSQPILELVRTTRAVTESKDYSVRAARYNEDEIGVLIEGFNGMLAQIQARDAALQKARSELEERVIERTRELENSLSLLNATLESTVDGILVGDLSGNVTGFNEQFLAMWRIPREVIETREAKGILDAVVPQLKDPQGFLARRTELYGSELESFDLIEFKDGRVFERFSKPQKIGQRTVGRVWSFRDITERKRAEAQLQAMHTQLLAASRQAGMAEVATNVLHNVGNVLNSVNISSSLISRNLEESKIPSLRRVVELLREHADDLPGFFAHHAKAQHVFTFLSSLAEHFEADRDKLLSETALLRGNVEHINEIVAMQQQYARISGVLEALQVSDVMEDALRMNGDGMERNQIRIAREYSKVPDVLVDRHKVLQILVNLLRNARHAVMEGGNGDKKITLRIKAEEGQVQIAVIDNGIGIVPENMVRIFAHGFTTRKDGHGFGLHSSALAAKELGGTLAARSEGLKRGAAFTLSLPLRTTAK